MKKQLKFILCAITIVICTMNNSLFAQFNVGGGWQDRWGQTNNPNPFNTIRRVGIGNFTNIGPRAALNIDANILSPVLPTAPNTFLPGEVFRSDGPSTNLNAWRLWTGTGINASEKGMIFNYGNNPVVADQTNFSIQATVRDMTFFTLPITANTVGTERMRIIGVNRILYPPILGVTTYPVRAGNVGIGTANPLAMVQIGLDAISGSGYRDWMNRGVLMYGSPVLFGSSRGSDNMYVGLQQVGPDNADAIINWGNNPIGNATADRLRFVFTAALGNGQASQPNGLETSRIIAFANSISRMGIGGDPTVNLYSTGSPDPQNTVEINSPATSASPGNSGLRFTDLNSASTIIPNPGTGVLSVDANGDVIYVPDPFGVGADLDWEYITSTGVFSGHTNTGGFNNRSVYVGVTPAMVPLLERPVKFGVFDVNGGVGNTGLYGLITGGFRNMMIHPPGSINSRAYGVFAEAEGNGCALDLTMNVGVAGQADNAKENYGGRFHVQATGTCNQFNAAVYAFCPSDGQAGTNYAGFFSGDLEYTGFFGFASDIRFKENIIPIQNGSNIINQLNPVSFSFKTSQYPTFSLPSGPQLGLIAQETEPILPEVVTNNFFPAQFDDSGIMLSDSFSYKSVDYTKLVPVLIQAFKELSAQNQNLQSQFTEMQDILSQCCIQTKSGTSDINAHIIITPDESIGKQTHLLQNRPNPFNTKTTFSYYLGENGIVELIIEDSYGRHITKLVNENQNKGDYTVGWNAENITPGIYFYSLKVNGIVLVKKAIKY